jgi:hypothetical protein
MTQKIWTAEEMSYLLNNRNCDAPISWREIGNHLKRSHISVRSKYYHFMGRINDLTAPVVGRPDKYNPFEDAVKKLSGKLIYHENYGYLIEGHPVTVTDLIKIAGAECR